jgi:hypothetical protein
LRPKEIQDRIRAGETAEEIADAAGIPPDKVRRFEGPVLAERQYRAQEAQRATIRSHGDAGPGPRLGDIVAERLSRAGANAESTEWDSRKRPDGNWQVLLQFVVGGRTSVAEWIYDPRRRHVIPDDEQSKRLCLPAEEWAAIMLAERTPTATVTPIGSRQHASQPDQPRDFERRSPAAVRSREATLTAAPASQPVKADHAAAHDEPDLPASAAAANTTAQPATPAKKAGRQRRASVPSWDEIMFGTSRQPD